MTQYKYLNFTQIDPNHRFQAAARNWPMRLKSHFVRTGHIFQLCQTNKIWLDMPKVFQKRSTNNENNRVSSWVMIKCHISRRPKRSCRNDKQRTHTIKYANRLGLLVNLEKTKIVVFKNRFYLARALWKFTTKVCLYHISEDSVSRAKQGTVEIF